MADLPDRKSLFAVGRRSIVTTPDLRINPKIIDVDGSDVNIALGAMSMMGEELSAAFSACMRGLFVQTAETDSLDRVAFDRYQITRFPSSPATVDVTLSRPTATFGAFTYPSGSRVQTAGGVQFVTNTDAVFGALTLTVEVPATALEAGIFGNVPAGSTGEGIQQFVEQPADTTLTVTNPGSAAGGTEQETDPDFRSRILAFFPTIRRGTLGAIEYGARQIPGVAVAKAFETLEACGCCFVRLIISDKQGGSSSLMLQAVRDIMVEYRPAGTQVVVEGVTIFQLGVTWEVQIESGFDPVNIADELRAITVATSQFLLPGATLYRSALIAAGRTIPGLILNYTSLIFPSIDAIPSGVDEMIRVAGVDVTITFIPFP
jgi:uncharacterized phage protein gp47/JayE